MRASAKILLGFCVPLALAAVVVVPNLLFLRSVGELSDAAELTARVQAGETCLTGLGTARLSSLEYKLEVYEQLKPETVVFGSSRAMQFRGDLFSGRYYNMGGLFGSIAEGDRTVAEMLKRHKPQTVLMTVDFWWFLGVNDVLGETQQPLPQRWRATMQSTLLPTFWALQRRLTLPQYVAVLDQGQTCQMGMLARLRQEGFLRDGSYFYGIKHLSTGQETFQDAYTKIDLSRSHYIRAPEMSEALFRRFMLTVDRLRKAGVNVVLVMPPVAPSVLAYMNKAGTDAYGYIAQLRGALAQSGVPFFDFHDAARTGAPDCEFIDAHHPGETAVARMLQQVDAAQVMKGIDSAGVARAIEAGENRTVSLPLLHKFYSGAEEGDSLNIGCVAQRRTHLKISG